MSRKTDRARIDSRSKEKRHRERIAFQCQAALCPVVALPFLHGLASGPFGQELVEVRAARFVLRERALGVIMRLTSLAVTSPRRAWCHCR